MPTFCPQYACNRSRSRTSEYCRKAREHAEQSSRQHLESITQIYEGTNQVQRLVMGRKLLA